MRPPPRLPLAAVTLILAAAGAAQTPVVQVPSLPTDLSRTTTNLQTAAGEIVGPGGTLLPDLALPREAPEPGEFEADEPFHVAKYSLRRLPVPRPANLADFIADEAAALILGKALFWDMQVGSDGVVACATCHFHAGADNRSRAQLNPGLLRVGPTGPSWADSSFQTGLPTRQLTPADFPLRQVLQPDNRSSALQRDSNDVVGSQGVVHRRFVMLNPQGEEQTVPGNDRVFTDGARSLRRVTPRQAPSVINAVFNVRNFWDGRAQRIFNGVNSWGQRDPGATVWRAASPGILTRVRIALDHSSLASQALSPALSSFEMSASGREFPHLGKRLLRQRPLARQQVHSTDSVLGPLAQPGGGLRVATYADLVRQAFKAEWWQGSALIGEDGVETEAEKQTRRRVAANNGLTTLADEDPEDFVTYERDTYTHLEANFSLFFGLALQIYESTLISDDTPFDRFAEGNAQALTAVQQRGLRLFTQKGRCVSCHAGAAFTAAARTEAPDQRVELADLLPRARGVYDAGFYNIGVRPILDDLGLGARDPWGRPLAESRLIALSQSTRTALTGYDEFFYQFPTDLVLGYGFFKTPGLRNVELTAPYFHHGGQATLEQVVAFYNRGGDFREWGHAAAVRPLQLTADEQAALVEFLKSLTDDRVRFDRAPFDHPQLRVPNGPSAPGAAAAELWIELPAVGAAGGPARRNFLQ